MQGLGLRTCRPLSLKHRHGLAVGFCLTCKFWSLCTPPPKLSEVTEHKLQHTCGKDSEGWTQHGAEVSCAGATQRGGFAGCGHSAGERRALVSLKLANRTDIGTYYRLRRARRRDLQRLEEKTREFDHVAVLSGERRHRFPIAREVCLLLGAQSAAAVRADEDVCDARAVPVGARVLDLGWASPSGALVVECDRPRSLRAHSQRSSEPRHSRYSHRPRPRSRRAPFTDCSVGQSRHVHAAAPVAPFSPSISAPGLTRRLAACAVPCRKLRKELMMAGNTEPGTCTCA